MSNINCQSLAIWAVRAAREKILNLKQCKNEGLDNKKAIAFKYMRVCHYLGSPEITGLEDQSIVLKIDI